MAEGIDLGKLFRFENLERDDKLVLVLLPFKIKYFELFENIIKPVVDEKDLNCIKADDPPTNNAIIKDIMENIFKSRFLIADITERNSNVLYEIGVADSIPREVIMINNRLKRKKQNYPFDVSYRRIVNYDDKIVAGEKFRKKLGDTIDYVLVNTAQSTSEPETQNIVSKKLHQLIWQSDLQYRLRTRRIEWFTYHPIHFFARFAKFHMDMLKELQILHFEFSPEKFDIIKKRCAGYIPHPEYMKKFVLTELNDTKDFISNAWLVNKFPDELNSFGLGSTLFNYLPTINDVEFEYRYDSIIENINFNLDRLKFYITAMQDERSEVGLRIINLDEFGLSTDDNNGD